MPDDAFYELQIARHFLATRSWSFDSGFTTTTGFHLLNVYLMAMFPSLFSDPWLAIRVWLIVGALVSIAAIFVICDFMFKQYGSPGLAAAIVVANSYSFYQENSSLLESPYVVLIAACYTAFLFGTRTRSRGLTAVFSLGLLGSLARSDFGGLALAIALVCLGYYLLRGQQRFLRRSLWGLGGATAGLGIVFLHNYHFSGHFLQGSAQVKALWAASSGYSLRPSFVMALRAIGLSSPSLEPGSRLIILLLLVVAPFLAYASARAGWVSAGGPYRLSDDECMLGVIGLTAGSIYGLVYALDGGVQA